MAARVFVSYSHIDENLRDQLEVQLTMLKRQGLIETWHDRRMLAGDQFDWAISEELNAAEIVLLLVSPDFLASDYCFNIEKAHALKRHREGSARLISVILRPCDWQNTDLRSYLVTPTDGKPVTLWPNIDEALLNVSQSIRAAINEIGVASSPGQTNEPTADLGLQIQAPEFPRSSNLRLKKEFSEAERDQFLFDAFEYMARFFQGSLTELQTRNEGIETRFHKPDGDSFVATIYWGGKKVAACGIRRGGSMMGNGISYSQGDRAPTNSTNETLSIGADDQKLYMSVTMGMHHFGNPPNRNEKLSYEGAAEYYWSRLIQPLQGN